MQMYASIWTEENENEDNKRRKKQTEWNENITIIEFAIVCNENKFANVFFLYSNIDLWTSKSIITIMT